MINYSKSYSQPSPLISFFLWLCLWFMIKKDRFGLFFFLLMLVCSTSKVVSASLRTLLSSIHSNTRLIFYPLEHSSYLLSTRTLVLSSIHSNTRLILYPPEHSSYPLSTRTLVLSSIHSNTRLILFALEQISHNWFMV